MNVETYNHNELYGKKIKIIDKIKNNLKNIQ